MTPRSRVHARGYILLECLVALSLLSMGAFVMQRAMREAFFAHGVARDFTQARFLLEDVVANIELQPMLLEGSDSGQFPDDFSRFRWEWAVSKVEIPLPPLPPDLPPEIAEDIELNVPYLAKIEATVSWKRRGKAYEKTIETLWRKEKIFVPEEVEP